MILDIPSNLIFYDSMHMVEFFTIILIKPKALFGTRMNLGSHSKPNTSLTSFLPNSRGIGHHMGPGIINGNRGMVLKHYSYRLTLSLLRVFISCYCHKIDLLSPSKEHGCVHFNKHIFKEGLLKIDLLFLNK